MPPEERLTSTIMDSSTRDSTYSGFHHRLPFSSSWAWSSFSLGRSGAWGSGWGWGSGSSRSMTTSSGETGLFSGCSGVGSL